MQKFLRIRWKGVCGKNVGCNWKRSSRMTEMNNLSFACHLFACHEKEGRGRRIGDKKRQKYIFLQKIL